MKLKNKALIVILSIVLLLEALPYGVVLNFANPEGEPWRRTFSFFSLTPFGYANFAPFITALLTVAIMILLIVNILKKSNALNKYIRYISGFTAAISLFPLIYGFDYITPVGIAVSLLLILCFILSLLKK